MKESLKHLLSQRQKQYLTNTSRVPSAVILPLFVKQEQYHILFIKRTETVKDHKGQISFPGGTQEEGESLLETALRECEEEINLRPEDAEVLGEMDDYPTVSTNYVVTPFVAVIPWPYQFRMNEYEVADIIEVPVSSLLDNNCVSEDIEIEDGEIVNSYVYRYQGKVIWGATARMLKHFLELYTLANRGMQQN